MQLFNTNAFITSLITVAAIAIPATGNAQFALGNCPNQHLDDRVEVYGNTESVCIQNAVETIYNPNPTWQPNL